MSDPWAASRRAVVAAALAAAVAVLPACGGGDDDTTTGRTYPATTAPASTTTTTTATTTTTTDQSPPADGIDTMPGAGTRPVTVPARNTSTALLTDVRAARHEGYDRVVFEFRNVLPGYDVRYVPRPVLQDGSGRAVTVAGAYVLRVRMDDALDADLEQDGAPRTYTGPVRISPQTPEIRELVRVGGFEGVLTWAIGVNDRADFRVLALRDPPRLVVDVRNH
jgi:hypothetical protein